MKPKSKNALRMLALAVVTTCLLLAAYLGFAGSVPDVSARASIALAVGVICFLFGDALTVPRKKVIDGSDN